MVASCPKCKSKMEPLFTSLYCPACANREEEEKRFLWRSPDKCPHDKDDHYYYDGQAWCRACGKHLFKINP